MLQMQPRQPRPSQTPDQHSRIFVPGREFATAKEFANFIREAEVVRIYGAGLWY